MFRRIFALALIVAGVLSCRTVPVTGRSQFILIPNAEMQAMSYQQYDTF